MHRRLAIFCIPALMLGLLSLWFLRETAGAQVTQPGGSEQSTVWSGVYTETQATRGEAIYEARCTGCHGDYLEGGRGRPNPPLKGEKFMERWREDSLLTLFTKMKTLMPRGDPGVLSEGEYLELTAHILRSNGFPAGPNDLNTSALRTILIQEKDGPKPLPHRAMIQVVGCMTKGEGDAWMLTMAPLPARAAIPDSTTPEELKASEAKPLGTLTFQLQNLQILGDVNHDGHKGHKMQAKGMLLKQSNGDRISVMSLEMLGPNCGQ